MATNDALPLHGTLDGLILKALSWGPRHGYAVARWIQETSNDTVAIEDRALYLALHRLEERRWVSAEWGLSDNNRKAKYYRLTAAGHRQLVAERARLVQYAQAIVRVFDAPAWERGR
ncbi:MAG TPA: PadR family transcriptional regulator [Gemmatimonadaceae bacterium]|jgi:transcriptional regulator